MGRRVGRTADPNAKLRGRRAGSRPKQTKNRQMRRPFGSARWSCSDGSVAEVVNKFTRLPKNSANFTRFKCSHQDIQEDLSWVKWHIRISDSSKTIHHTR